MGVLHREYEFFVTTDERQQPDDLERGLIRRLVMRNFFEAKTVGPAKDSSEHNSAKTVRAKTQLKTRFRLLKVENESLEAKSRQNKGQEQSITTIRKRPIARRTVFSEEYASNRTEGGTSSKASSSSKSTHAEIQTMMENPSTQQDRRIVLNLSPGAHRVDPFDVLPVPGTPKLDMLFKLYKNGSRKNSIAVNTSHTWWSFIRNDSGLLHATLATWALYGMLVRGLRELQVDMLKHKNEAIREINMKIGASDYKISDELVGIVVTMASFENLLGAYDAAQLHVSALKRMVEARGGLSAFEHNDGLVRGIAWVDFHTATVFRTPPSFPRIYSNSDTSTLPEELLEEAACTSPTSLLQLSVAAIDCFNIFYRLHRVALAACSHWRDRVDRLALSNLLYELEYLILSVPDRSRDFLKFDLNLVSDEGDEYSECESAANAASVIEALVAASQIFIYAALRDVPVHTRIFGILLERLSTAISRLPAYMISIWRRERNLIMLLWSLVVACSVIQPGAERAWWIKILAEVMNEMNIQSRFQLETALKHVAWVDGCFNSVLGGIWEQCQIHDSSSHVR